MVLCSSSSFPFVQVQMMQVQACARRRQTLHEIAGFRLGGKHHRGLISRPRAIWIVRHTDGFSRMFYAVFGVSGASV